jgi:hypothetical protein
MAEPEQKQPRGGGWSRNKTLASGGGPPHGTSMEERVTPLEVSRIGVGLQYLSQ